MQWRPIEPLSGADRSTYVGDVDALMAYYHAQLGEAQRHAAEVSAVLDRYRREFAIETGILERLYSIDRGTTTLLIEKGFLADYLERTAAGPDPIRLVAILHDHEDGIELVHSWVRHERPLSAAGIRELHQVLTRNQEHVEGIDHLGRVVRAPMLRGEWKRTPNNPTRANGSVHEYCPPVHVSTEMDRLAELFDDYDDVHPVILCAWLHHRFAQIHPFQDGNGRVARTLMNFALIRGALLPLVITRDKRVRYIEALEAADAGDLPTLIRFFAESLCQRITSLASEVGRLGARPWRPSSAAEAAAALIDDSDEPAADGPPDWGTWAETLDVKLAELVHALEKRMNAPFVARDRWPPFSIWSAGPGVPDPVYGELAERPGPFWQYIVALARKTGHDLQAVPTGFSWRIAHDGSRGDNLLLFDLTSTEPAESEHESSAPWLFSAIYAIHRADGELDLGDAGDGFLVASPLEPVDQVVRRFDRWSDRAATRFLGRLRELGYSG